MPEEVLSKIYMVFYISLLYFYNFYISLRCPSDTLSDVILVFIVAEVAVLIYQ